MMNCFTSHEVIIYACFSFIYKETIDLNRARVKIYKFFIYKLIEKRIFNKARNYINKIYELTDLPNVGNEMREIIIQIKYAN